MIGGLWSWHLWNLFAGSRNAMTDLESKFKLWTCQGASFQRSCPKGSSFQSGGPCLRSGSIRQSSGALLLSKRRMEEERGIKAERESPTSYLSSRRAIPVCPCKPESNKPTMVEQTGKRVLGVCLCVKEKGLKDVAGLSTNEQVSITAWLPTLFPQGVTVRSKQNGGHEPAPGS